MARSRSEFSTTHLALADARLALGILNYVRYGALEKAFGVSREQANVVTFVLLVLAADGAFVAATKVARLRPPHLAGSDAAIGALAIREGAFSIAGPNVRKIPALGALIAVAVVGAAGMPALRRTAIAARDAERWLRQVERRVRMARIGRYAAATRGQR
jgi:hypothetical protein